MKWWFKKKTMAEEEIKKDAEVAGDASDSSGSSCPSDASTASDPSDPSNSSNPSDSGVTSDADQPAKPAEPDWKDQYARLLADFDNFKKRAARDRDDTYRYVESQVLTDLLPTVDNLAMALDKAENKDDPFVKGVKLVYDGLLKMLKDHDAEPFDSVGKDLDIEKMEAIAQLPSPDVEEGKVSIESKKGWMLKGKVLRAAQVVVSSGKPA